MLVNKSQSGYEVFCVPSHYYCNLSCVFCHLTNGNKKPMLQVDWPTLKSSLEYFVPQRQCDRTLYSFMGAGEAVLNPKMFLDCAVETRASSCYGVATMGSGASKLKNFLKMCVDSSLPVKMHYSLHHPDDFGRKERMPSAEKSTPIFEELVGYRDNLGESVRRAIQEFHSDSDSVELHYTMIDGWNDTQDCLDKIIGICLKYDFKIKLLHFRPKDNMKATQKMHNWERSLTLSGVRVKNYNPPGEDIGSACGMFPQTAL